MAGARAAQRLDGSARTRFLAWFAWIAPTGRLTEIEAADRLAALRAENPAFRDLSFRTISGAGPNGAIVHYSVSAKTNRHIEPGQLYLLDSGAQYPDGTTDVTRSEEHTSELQSLMRISYAVFCLKKNKTPTQRPYDDKR